MTKDKFVLSQITEKDEISVTVRADISASEFLEAVEKFMLAAGYLPVTISDAFKEYVDE